VQIGKQTGVVLALIGYMTDQATQSNIQSNITAEAGRIRAVHK